MGGHNKKTKEPYYLASSKHYMANKVYFSPLFTYE